MERNEIFQIGSHRLLCGDATNINDVIRLVGNEHINLVLTDPPYGIKTQSFRSGGKIGSTGRSYPFVIGDTNSDMAREHYHIVRGLCNSLIIWGGQNFTDFLPPSSGWLFWDKCRNTDRLAFGDGELAWSNIGKRIRKYSFKWNGTALEGSRVLNEKVHPMQKPVELYMKILEDFSNPGDVILDCFGGSGTTLIACELTGRKCLMMEISPEYCQIIINRYAKTCSKEMK